MRLPYSVTGGCFPLSRGSDWASQGFLCFVAPRGPQTHRCLLGTLLPAASHATSGGFTSPPTPLTPPSFLALSPAGYFELGTMYL